MKKIISGISALVIMAAMAVPFSAFAEDVTTINPTGGTPFSVDPKPGTANTTVQFEVNPAYTVTIPAKVTLTGEYGSTYTGTGTISTDKVFLNEGKKIVVSLTSASKFNMKTEETKEYQLPYTAEGAFGKLTEKANGGKVAEFETSTTAKTVDISFTTDETPKYAGSYTDPVVFTIAVQDAAAVSANPFDAADGALYIQIRYDDYDTKLNFTKSGDTYTYVSGQMFADRGATLTKSGDNLVLHVMPTRNSTADYDLTIDTVNNTYTVSRNSTYGTPITLTNWKYGDTDLASLLTKA